MGPNQIYKLLLAKEIIKQIDNLRLGKIFPGSATNKSNFQHIQTAHKTQ